MNSPTYTYKSRIALVFLCATLFLAPPQSLLALSSSSVQGPHPATGTWEKQSGDAPSPKSVKVTPSGIMTEPGVEGLFGALDDPPEDGKPEGRFVSDIGEGTWSMGRQGDKEVLTLTFDDGTSATYVR